jgi:hypothetical protein
VDLGNDESVATGTRRRGCRGDDLQLPAGNAAALPEQTGEGLAAG